MNVDVDQSGFVEITWQVPANLTHQVLGYNLTYQVIGIGDCNSTYRGEETLVTLPREIRRYVLSSLVPWRLYRLVATAGNIAGGGAAVEEEFFSHERGIFHIRHL